MPTLSQRVGNLQESAIRKLDMVVRRQQGVSFHRLRTESSSVRYSPHCRIWVSDRTGAP